MHRVIHLVIFIHLLVFNRLDVLTLSFGVGLHKLKSFNYRDVRIKVSTSSETCWWQAELQSPYEKEKRERPLQERLFALSS